jgi:hypothetical protein
MTIIKESSVTDDDFLTDYVKRKESLNKTAFAYKRSIVGELKDLKLNLNKWTQVAIVVGGALVVSYVVYRMFSGGSDKVIKGGGGSKPVKIKTYTEESPIIRMIKENIATFLLSIAKQKLMEFLEQQKIANAPKEDI